MESVKMIYWRIQDLKNQLSSLEGKLNELSPTDKEKVSSQLIQMADMVDGLNNLRT